MAMERLNQVTVVKLAINWWPRLVLMMMMMMMMMMCEDPISRPDMSNMSTSEELSNTKCRGRGSLRGYARLF